MTFRRVLAVVTLLLSATTPLVAASFRAEASATWAENIGRSSAASDWRDAWRYEARAAYSLFREWRSGLITTGEAQAGFEHTPRFSEQTAFNAGVSGQVRQKFGLGAFAPSLALDAGLRRRAAAIDGDDGWTATAGLRIARRLTQAWRIAATGDWQQHYGRSSIFDTRHHRFFGTLTWDVSPRWQLSHGNGRLWGDFTANASAGVWARALGGDFGPAIESYYNTVSWGVTNGFGPAWVTYRVTGQVSFWWLELSPALGRNTSLPLRYDSLFSVNKVGIKYRQDLWSVQLLYRF